MKIGIVTDAHLFHKNSNIELYKNVIFDLQNKVDIIVDCGDLTDSNTITATQTESLFEIFNYVNIPFHILRGNHDTSNGISVSSLLPMNKNIIVHNDVGTWENILFVPYINSVKELIAKLKLLNLQIPLDYAFSHLNITKNLYASIPFENTKFLHFYAYKWINGHIHTPEIHSAIYGTVENIGSFSNLTFNDEHIPTYAILDTTIDKIEKYEIAGSIIHKTFDDTDSDQIKRYAISHSDMKLNCRIKLPNNFYVDDRQKLKQDLLSLSNINSVQFDYVKDVTNKTIDEKNNIQLHKKPLIQQLFEQYEKDENKTIDKELKSKLTE